MTILELVSARPDWTGALGVALTRPAGMPERRAADDPWTPESVAPRPRRISDDLAWFRQAVDEPAEYGLEPIDDTATVAAWSTNDSELHGRLTRLRDRGVLEAAGFLLHEDEIENLIDLVS